MQLHSCGEELKRSTEKHVRANQGNIKTKIGDQKTNKKIKERKKRKECEITPTTETDWLKSTHCEVKSDDWEVNVCTLVAHVQFTVV